jgi:hypothetical protein
VTRPLTATGPGTRASAAHTAARIPHRSLPRGSSSPPWYVDRITGPDDSTRTPGSVRFPVCLDLIARPHLSAAMRAPGVGDWVMPCDCAFGEVGGADRLERGRSLPPGRLGGYLRRHGELSCTGHRRQHGHWQGDRAPARCRRLRPLYIAERSSSLEGCGALAAACVSCTAPRPARPGLRNCAAR